MTSISLVANSQSHRLFTKTLLIMAPFATGTSVHSMFLSSANIQGGTAVLFYPILLRAVLYIATNGELRVTTPCLSEEVAKNDVTMVKMCNRAAGGNKLCLYASKDGSHFLAASKETGRLLTIRDNSARQLLNSSTPSPYCLAFEEVQAGDLGRSKIIACPSSKRYTLSFDRLQLPTNASCEISRQQSFSQAVSRGESSRQRNMVVTMSKAFAQENVCPARSKSVWKRCHGQMLSSFHLNWRNCS